MTDATNAAPSERERFEIYAKDRGYRLDRSTGGGYLYGQAAVAWRAWKACAEQATRDAARYRWLRTRWARITESYTDNDGSSIAKIEVADDAAMQAWGWDKDVDPDSLDAAIDAAMEKER